MKYLVLLLLIPFNSYGDQLTIQLSKVDGGIYFGGLKTSFETTKVSLEYNKSYTLFNYGIQLDHLLNESEFKMYQLALEGGVHHNFNSSLKAYLQAQLGFSVFHEESTMQKTADIGPLLGSELALEYVYKSMAIRLGYQWQHAYWGSSYWGKDIFNDVAVDVHGAFLGLGYKF